MASATSVAVAVGSVTFAPPAVFASTVMLFGSVSVGAEMARFKVHNVVHVKCIRDNSKWFVTNMVGFDWLMRLTGRSDI